MFSFPFLSFPFLSSHHSGGTEITSPPCPRTLTGTIRRHGNA
jgi:hypothetical protein